MAGFVVVDHVAVAATSAESAVPVDLFFVIRMTSRMREDCSMPTDLAACLMLGMLIVVERPGGLGKLMPWDRRPEDREGLGPRL